MRTFSLVTAVFMRWFMVGVAAAAASGAWARQPVSKGIEEETQSVREESGWTPLSPSAASRMVYVASGTGNDENSGLTPNAPKRSLGAAYELMRDGHADWMVLKRGDTWNEGFPSWNKGGRSAGEPMVIGSYGTGPRPLLRTASGQGFISIAYEVPLAHLALVDLHFTADRADGSSLDSGVTFLNRWSDVLIENCKVEAYRNNIVVEPLDSRPSNIRVRRCVIVDAFTTLWNAQGIYCGGVDGCLIEECVFDHNGWRRGVPGAHSTMFNHNMYLHGTCTGMVTRGNITARASATGISQRCAGICEDNLILQNPVGAFLGGGPQYPGSGVRSAMRNNVAFDSRDIDSITPRGFALWVGGIYSAEVYGNIVSSHRSGSDNVVGIYLTSDLHSVSVVRNVVYDWTLGTTGLGILAELERGRGVTITDNTLVQPHGGFLIGYVPNTGADLGRVFGRNRYFTANGAPHQFYYGLTYSDWVGYSDEVYAAFGAPGFPSPQRNVGTYMASLGLTPTMEAFLDRARLQERTSWDPRFTAAAVNAYVRAGFGVGRRGCSADFNDDGALNIFDFVAFQEAAAAGSPRADIDLDGAFTMADVAVFQGRFALGCP